MTQNVVEVLLFFFFPSLSPTFPPSNLPSPVYMCLRVCSTRLPALVYTGPLVLSFALACPYLLRQRPPGHQHPLQVTHRVRPLTARCYAL